MKLKLFLALAILVLVIGYVGASGPVPKAACGICKKAFINGDDKIERMIGGKFKNIHLDHRDEEKKAERLKLIEQHFSK